MYICPMYYLPWHPGSGSSPGLAPYAVLRTRSEEVQPTVVRSTPYLGRYLLLLYSVLTILNSMS